MGAGRCLLNPGVVQESLLEVTSELPMGWEERVSQGTLKGLREQQVLRSEGAQSCACLGNRKKVCVIRRQSASRRESGGSWNWQAGSGHTEPREHGQDSAFDSQCSGKPLESNKLGVTHLICFF